MDANLKATAKVAERDGSAGSKLDFHFLTRNQIEVIIRKEAGVTWRRQVNRPRKLVGRQGDFKSAAHWQYVGLDLRLRQRQILVGSKKCSLLDTACHPPIPP